MPIPGYSKPDRIELQTYDGETLTYPVNAEDPSGLAAHVGITREPWGQFIVMLADDEGTAREAYMERAEFAALIALGQQLLAMPDREPPAGS